MGGLCMLVMHPQVIGRPSRMRFLEAFVEWALDLDDVWVAAAGEIAATMLAAPGS